MTTIEDNDDNIGFSELLEQERKEMPHLKGALVSGRVVSVAKNMVLVDAGLKSDAYIPLHEFLNEKNQDGSKINPGDQFTVYVEHLDSKNGEIQLSRSKALQEESWKRLYDIYNKGEYVEGIVVKKIKGGFIVNIESVHAFLPISQIDVKPVHDFNFLMSASHQYAILKMDMTRGNIIVSRKSVLEAGLSEKYKNLLKNLDKGQIVEGIVKNITDYGAFVDLGGIDGLLHITDLSWKRISHPSEILEIGERIKAKIIRYKKENKRIGLGIKQLTPDPWINIESKYPVGSKFTGKITKIADYGAFVELEPGIEGLVHVSEMSWLKKNFHPSRLVATNQEVEVIIISIEEDKRRISLGMKQCQDNPWQVFAQQNKIGDIIEGEISKITEFGIFVSLNENIDGMIHISDISWDRTNKDAMTQYRKGEMIKTKILDIDANKNRVAIGIKQLKEDYFSKIANNYSKKDIVTSTITRIAENSIEVLIEDKVIGIIKRSELSSDKNEQNPQKRFAVGERVDAKITKIDHKERIFMLSIKQRELEEEKEAIQQYGSASSGASLGEILGSAFEKAKKNEKKDDNEKTEKVEKAEKAEKIAKDESNP